MGIGTNRLHRKVVTSSWSEWRLDRFDTSGCTCSNIVFWVLLYSQQTLFPIQFDLIDIK